MVSAISDMRRFENLLVKGTILIYFLPICLSYHLFNKTSCCFFNGDALNVKTDWYWCPLPNLWYQSEASQFEQRDDTVHLCHHLLSLSSVHLQWPLDGPAFFQSLCVPKKSPQLNQRKCFELQTRYHNSIINYFNGFAFGSWIQLPTCVLYTIRQFSDASRVSDNSTQFWYYLPAGSIRIHWLRIQYHKIDAHSLTLDTSLKPRLLLPVLLTNCLQIRDSNKSLQLGLLLASQGCYLYFWPISYRSEVPMTSISLCPSTLRFN